MIEKRIERFSLPIPAESGSVRRRDKNRIKWKYSRTSSVSISEVDGKRKEERGMGKKISLNCKKKKKKKEKERKIRQIRKKRKKRKKENEITMSKNDVAKRKL